MSLKQRWQRGDTIVEVLIAIAVASAVLGSSYYIVNRTLANSQQAQEHSEALGIAQGQVEQLKVMAEQGTPADISALYDTSSTLHCFADDGSRQEPVSPFTPPATDDSSYPDACKGLGTAHFYRTITEYNAAGNYFITYVNWPSATGHGQDEVTLSYRPFKG